VWEVAADLRASVQRYPCMTMTWTIVAWLTLQLPLAVFVGRFMKFGFAQPVQQTSATPKGSVPRGTSAFRRQSVRSPRRAMASGPAVAERNVPPVGRTKN